ncbi:MAG: transporter substrate-binding protein, partial [Microvirga sp.]|nr:transporter substrate-binding protein [Microvirga sp.]
VEQWGDDWPWQILITQQGGHLLDESQTKVTFDQNGHALKAMKLVKRLVDEGKYDPAMTASDQMKSFTSGTMGIYANSPASARNIKELVGDKFDLRSVKFTIVDNTNGTLPTGGNAMLITATNPEKIAAAWEYAKFMSGPKAQAITAMNTGYLPTNVGSLGEGFLAPYYREREPVLRHAGNWLRPRRPVAGLSRDSERKDLARAEEHPPRGDAWRDDTRRGRRQDEKGS